MTFTCTAPLISAVNGIVPEALAMLAQVANRSLRKSKIGYLTGGMKVDQIQPLAKMVR